MTEKVIASPGWQERKRRGWNLFYRPYRWTTLERRFVEPILGVGEDGTGRYPVNEEDRTSVNQGGTAEAYKLSSLASRTQGDGGFFMFWPFFTSNRNQVVNFIWEAFLLKVLGKETLIYGSGHQNPRGIPKLALWPPTAGSSNHSDTTERVSFPSPSHIMTASRNVAKKACRRSWGCFLKDQIDAGYHPCRFTRKAIGKIRRGPFGNSPKSGTI